MGNTAWHLPSGWSSDHIPGIREDDLREALENAIVARAGVAHAEDAARRIGEACRIVGCPRITRKRGWIANRIGGWLDRANKYRANWAMWHNTLHLPSGGGSDGSGGESQTRREKKVLEDLMAELAHPLQMKVGKAELPFAVGAAARNRHGIASVAWDTLKALPYNMGWRVRYSPYKDPANFEWKTHNVVEKALWAWVFPEKESIKEQTK